MADLKTLFQMVESRSSEESLQKAETMDLSELGQKTVNFGKKYLKKTFQTAFQDKSYVKWCIDHVDLDKSTPEMREFMIYLRRMLEKEAASLAQPLSKKSEASGKESPPKGQVNSTRNKTKMVNVNPEDQASASVDPLMERKGYPKPESEICEWDHVLIDENPAQVEIMEGEMMNLQHRMSQVEGMLNEIVCYMRAQQTEPRSQ